MNPVVHFDIPVSNPANAKAFYEKLFGWKISEVPGMHYWMVLTTPSDPKTSRPKKAGAINGGIGMRKDAGDIQHPYFTVDVANIEETLAEVKASGGKVIRPKTSMGEWGEMAVFEDPDGNTIGLYHMHKPAK